MNKIHKIKHHIIWLFLLTLLTPLVFTSCEDDEEGGPITISKVYLEDVNSTVQDREVTFARLGQLIRIEGSGFTGLRKVYINGYSTYFNPVYVTDESMMISIDDDTPIVDAEDDVRNTIRMVNDNNENTLSFEIRDAAPTITSISNTMPLAGETIRVYGTGLIEVSSVLFPGDIEVTDGITSYTEGEYFDVVVPESVSEEGGSLFITCGNGGAYSPAYFNFKAGVILDFDGNGTQGYWTGKTSMIFPDDLESTSLGTTNVSQGTYVPHRPSRISSFTANSNRCSEVWTAGNGTDDWRGQLTSYIPTTTSIDEIAFQFDIYVPEEWSNSGYLKICLVNGFNGGEWYGACYNYVPWIVDGEVVPYQTEGWTTVTIPLNYFYYFSDGDYTFEDILAYREAASYKNFGFYFENSNFSLDDITGDEDDEATEYTATETSIDVYTDNWRIVSLETPTYSDFTDE